MALQFINYKGINMKNTLKNIALVSAMACIPLLAQASPLIGSKNIDKQIDNKNTGTVTIMNCAPYPICRDVKNKTSQDKPKKDSK